MENTELCPLLSTEPRTVARIFISRIITYEKYQINKACLAWLEGKGTKFIPTGHQRHDFAFISFINCCDVTSLKRAHLASLVPLTEGNERSSSFDYIQVYAFSIRKNFIRK